MMSSTVLAALNPDLVPYALGRATLPVVVGAAMLVPGVVLLRRHRSPVRSRQAAAVPAVSADDSAPAPKGSTRSQPRMWGTALLVVGALLLAIGLKGFVGDVFGAVGNTGARGGSATFPVGDCITYADDASPKPRLVPSDCAAPTSVLELAAIMPAGRCPAASYYVGLTTTQKTYCWMPNLFEGRCYRVVGDAQEAMVPVECSDPRANARVLLRTESGVDPATCGGPGWLAVNYETPPRGYCLQILK